MGPEINQVLFLTSFQSLSPFPMCNTCIIQIQWYSVKMNLIMYKNSHIREIHRSAFFQVVLQLLAATNISEFCIHRTHITGLLTGYSMHQCKLNKSASKMYDGMMGNSGWLKFSWSPSRDAIRLTIQKYLLQREIKSLPDFALFKFLFSRIIKHGIKSCKCILFASVKRRWQLCLTSALVTLYIAFIGAWHHNTIYLILV